jgi:hypothetical protein
VKRPIAMLEVVSVYGGKGRYTLKSCRLCSANRQQYSVEEKKRMDISYIKRMADDHGKRVRAAMCVRAWCVCVCVCVCVCEVDSKSRRRRVVRTLVLAAEKLLPIPE